VPALQKQRMRGQQIFFEGPMNPNRKRLLIYLALGFTVAVILYGFINLYSAPYTGIQAAPCGEEVCVENVAPDGPAWTAGIRAGDRIMDVGGPGITYHAFYHDQHYLDSREGLRLFWEGQKLLSREMAIGKQTRFLIKRSGKDQLLSVTPGPFPLSEVAKRLWPLYLPGLVFVVIAGLVFGKMDGEVSFANFIFLTSASLIFLPIAHTVRDLAFPVGAHRLQVLVNELGVFFASFSLFHLALVFPRRRKILDRHPWLVKAIYTSAAVLFLLCALRWIPPIRSLNYLSGAAGLLACMGAMCYDFFTEKDLVYKKQIQWAIYGFAGGALWFLIIILSIVAGRPFPEALMALPSVLVPISMAFAITRYRLMEIDELFDYAVVYGLTILVLEAAELAFLGGMSPFIPLDRAGRYLPMAGVLLIVFLYIPVRNLVFRLVKAFFKRGGYDGEKELQRFTVTLGLCDDRPILAKFSSFVKDLLGPSGILVLKIGDGDPSVLYADSEQARKESAAILSTARAVWKFAGSRRASAFGYEFSNNGAVEKRLFTPEMENAVFVPFMSDPDDAGRGYLAVLLKKWNGTPYSKKDLILVNAIAVNIANIIETGELRRERAEIEKRFIKEKNDVMRELHDGLGNLLTSIAVASQAAQRVSPENAKMTGELVARIGEYSTEAMDFLRTGLMVLDEPDRDMGDLMTNIWTRFSELFSAYGLELHLEVGDDVRGARAGALVAMNVSRCILEALNNVMKHSGAKNVNIRLSGSKDRIEVVIEDDGKGFSVETAQPGFGLKNMALRMQKLRGNMIMQSFPGKGARVRFLVPLTENGGGA
jgi:signal transduction histidine kinase